MGKRQSYAGFMCGFMQVLCGSYVSVLCGFYAGHIKKDFFFRSSYAGLMGVLNCTLYIYIFFLPELGFDHTTAGKEDKLENTTTIAHAQHKHLPRGRS